MSKKKNSKKSPAKKKSSSRWPKMLADDQVVAEAPLAEVTPESETEAHEPEDGGELNLEFAEDDETTEASENSEISETSEESEIAEVLAASEVEDDIDMETSSDSDADRMKASEVGDAMDDGEGLGEGSGEEPAQDLGELAEFESAQIEDVEMISAEQLRSVIESILFTTDKPISIALIKQAFKGTQVKSKDIREALHQLMEEYNSSARGFTLDEIAGGFQLRTKADNMKYLRQGVKARPFKLSGPALEVLSIVAYKQPVTKHQIDEIRGVESGHLLRALMEKHLLTFGERSDLPGKPMFYETTRKFLEIFGLRNLAELPSLHEIDQLIPEGIGGDEPKKEKLSDLTGQLSEQVGAGSYSVGEEELLKITDELSTISTSSEFFEQEKERQRQKRDADRAQDIKERQIVGEEIEAKDLRWLERYEAGQLAAAQSADEVEFVVAAGEMAEPNVGDVEAVPEEHLSEERLDAMIASDEDLDEASRDDVSTEEGLEQEALSDDGGNSEPEASL